MICALQINWPCLALKKSNFSQLKFLHWTFYQQTILAKPFTVLQFYYPTEENVFISVIIVFEGDYDYIGKLILLLFSPSIFFLLVYLTFVQYCLKFASNCIPHSFGEKRPVNFIFFSFNACTEHFKYSK